MPVTLTSDQAIRIEDALQAITDMTGEVTEDRVALDREIVIATDIIRTAMGARP